jgi:hypothetical protein
MVPINAAPDNPIKPMYKTPDFDEPEPGNSAITSGTVIGANVVVVVVVVVEVVDVVVVVSGATVVAGGMYFFFATVVVVVEVVVVVGIATLATIESDVAFIDSGNATYPAGNAA